MSDKSDRWNLVRGADIPPSLRLTLYVLHCMQGSNATAFCSRATLADEVGVHVDSLSRQLRALEDLGAIRSVWTRRNGRPSREHAIDYVRLRQIQRPTLAPASEWECSTLTPASSHSCASVGSTLAPAQDMNIHRTSKNNPKGEPPDFPPELNTAEFRTAWSDWTTFRREIKKPLTPTTVKQQLAKLAKWGSAKAVQSIENSIGGSWQGLFDPDQRSGKTGTAASPESEQAWQAVLASLRRHSIYSPDKVRTEVGERAWQAVKAVGGLKPIEGANEFEKRELRKRFIQAWQQKGAA